MTDDTYPILTSDPDGPYFARPTDPDEGYEFGWVCIYYPDGTHVAEGTREVMQDLVDTLNRRTR